MRRCADRLKDDGYDLAGYSLAERVDDLDGARRAMGYPRVDLLSESFGTRVALIYAWRHPQSIRRSVMIGVNPPGHFVWQPEQTDAQLRRFAALGAGDSVAAMHRTMPKRWGPFPIHRGNVELASFFGLTDASSEAAPISAPMTLDAWRAAAKGDASGLWFQSLASALLFPRIQVWGDTAAMGRIDAATAAEHFHPGQGANSVLRDSASRFLWAGGALADAWPASPGEDAYSRIRDSERRDAPDQRRTRRRDAGRERHQRPAPAPAQRPPGPAAGLRPHDGLLEHPGRRRQPPDQRLSGQRSRRQLALRPAEARLHAAAHADQAREDPRRRDDRAGPLRRAVAGLARNVARAWVASRGS